MFGIIQERCKKPRVLRESKKNESTVFKPIPSHRIDYDEVLELIAKDKVDLKYVKHSHNQIFARELNKRLNKKLEEYEESVEKRRERLRDLLWQEERDLVREAVDDAQRGEENLLQEMKIRIQELRIRRESDRLEVVKEKKLKQYLDKCDEFRPVMAQRRFAETKQAQLIQMRENENRKASEKELNNLWYDLLLKEISAQAEREKQERLAKKKQQAMNRSTWATQCKYLELQKEQTVRETKEDLIKMNNLKEEWRREEITNLDAKRRKRDEWYKDIVLQIKQREEHLARESEREAAEFRLFRKLQDDEIEKERLKTQQNQTAKFKEEMDQFMDYLARLDQERREEEKRLNELVQQELKEIQARQDEAQCKLKKAREKLNKGIKEELEEQMEYRRQEAEEQLKIKETENQLIQLAYEQNERLRAEYERHKLLAAKQYKDDLKKQIEYRKLQKEREKEELRKLLERGKLEEEEYRKVLLTILNAEVKAVEVHPFRKLLDQKSETCHKFY